MLAFYIYNNVRIDFQCFAGGLLFGVGSIFFLVYNGLHIGAVAGHLTRVGYGETFWGFVAGHSSFELLGAVLAGAAGLRIGYALVAPGRAHARRRHARGGTSGGIPALRRRGDDRDARRSSRRSGRRSATLPARSSMAWASALWVAWLLYFASCGAPRAAVTERDAG